jgi:hypothetical protein
MRKVTLIVSAIVLLVLFAHMAIGYDSNRDGTQAAQNQGKSKKNALFGGRFLFQLKNDENITGVIYSITGEGDKKEIILTDGRRLAFAELSMINCHDMETAFPDDENKIHKGVQTLILEDGTAIYSEITDFAVGKSYDSRFFVLEDGRKFNWKQVYRIYFR